jgi:RNA polymerase sigma-70 factor (ECF subfamily)
MNPKELLAHSDFIKALAYRLVMDEQRAADIEQLTWIAALEAPLEPKKPVRSWLSRIVRNFARIAYREEQLRKARENLIPIATEIPSPDEIATREEARRELLDAVLSLDEPYRTTIVGCYYKEQTHREVAEQLGIPVETVRTRLKRGLKKLKHKLDSAYKGNRDAWCTALLPLAGLKLVPGAAAVQAGKAGTAALILAALAKFKVAAVVALLALGSIFTVPIILPGLFHEEVAEETGALTGSFIEEETYGEAAPQALEAKRERIEPSGDEAGASPALVEPNLVVMVLDHESLEPVDAFDFRLLEPAPDRGWTEQDHRTVRSDEGLLSLYLEPGKPKRIEVRSSGHLMKSSEAMVSVDEKGTETIRILLDPGRSFRGKVLDGFNGRPVAGALVGAAGKHTDSESILAEPALDALWRGHAESFSHAVTDEEGRFLLQGLDLTDDRVVVLHDAYAQKVVTMSGRGSPEAVIYLDGGARIFGTARDDQGRPAAGIAVHVAGVNDPLIRPVLTEADGTFETPPLHPGPLFLFAERCKGITSPDIRFAREFVRIELGNHDEEVHFGPSKDKVTWSGTLHDPEGDACARGTINLWAAETDPATSYTSFSRRTIQCDASGRFEIAKLQPGTYEAYIRVQDRGLKGRKTCSFHRPGRIEEDIRLRPAAIKWFVLDSRSGEIVEGHTGTVFLKDPRSHTGSMSATLAPDGSFRFSDVPAGIYDFLLNLSGSVETIRVPGVTIGHEESAIDRRIEIPPLGELEIVATGFHDVHDLMLKFEMYGEEEFLRGSYSLDFSGTEEIKSRVYTATSGKRLLCLSHEHLGTVERWVEIPPRATARLTLDVNEFTYPESDITARGRILDIGGAPLVNKAFTALGRAVGSKNREGKWIIGTTDSFGRFRLEGLNPGYLDLEVQVSGERKITLPRLRITDGQGKDISLDLEIPKGGVRGILRDRATGIPIEVQGRQMQLTLWKSGHDELPILDLKSKDSVFHLYGAGPGEYRLMVAGDGYYDWRSEPFRIEEGRIEDLGAIDLVPCAAIRLRVSDHLGGVPDQLEVFANGLKLRKSELRMDLAAGEFWFDEISPGFLELEVNAPGYVPYKKALFNQAGISGTEEIVLQPE